MKINRKKKNRNKNNTMRKYQIEVTLNKMINKNCNSKN